MKRIVLIVLLVLGINNSCFASTLSTHLSISMIVSEHVDTNWEAFTYNALLHPMLDYYDLEYYMDGINANEDYIAFECILSGIQIYRIIGEDDIRLRKRLIWGAVGATIFDILEIPNKLNDEPPLFDWHYNHGGNTRSKQSTMGTSLLTFYLTYKF